MDNIIDIQAVKFGEWLRLNAEAYNGNWRYLNYQQDYTTEEMYQKYLDNAVEKLNRDEDIN